jgi:hypothetical protein
MHFYFYEDGCCVLPQQDDEVEGADADQILLSVDFTTDLTQWDETIADLLLAANKMDAESGPYVGTRSPLLERMMSKAFNLGREYQQRHHKLQKESS